jgi:uncharacterized protein DUF4160
MPTVLRVKGYRFFFFSLEGKEPPHIHVEQADRYAKLWLAPVSIARTKGFRSGELTDIFRFDQNNQQLFQERWHEHFGHKI